MTATQPRLLDQLRDRIRLKHYSIRTEQAYLDWARRFILFHGKRHPAGMGKDDVEAFLSHLAVKGRVAASTQNQAKSAILFLYREVLGQELAWLENVEQAKAPKRLPVVLTQAEVAAVLARMPDYHRLMAQLLYGCGLRLMECVRLRVKDVDFAQREIIVREGKGFKDRVTMLPKALVSPSPRRRTPCAIPCHPSAATGLRHPYRAGTARHSDVSTTMIYTHVLNRGGRGVVSPLDGL